ncbi:hypothetical protein JG688_00001515 [Phytophthora aleatoria]|uniref:Uncharacterized protein n=1 Tax=Phytophthora aleatoria TaxID=2496075 RepID=A0A8J5M9F9_9STRA|nr:hypothetical protein JG688_00001515 [Phytophthora aleatoria]
MPCAHQIHAAVINGRGLLPTQFHSHWWIDRSRGPIAPPARVLESDTIADRRAQRRADRRLQRQRGGGRWGTCRTPSLF